jgi:hypothetical protein
MSNIGLEQAETCLDRGDYDKCIEQLCTVVEALLASRIDSVIHLALIQQSWPDAGVRLLRTERGFCLVPLKTTFSIRDCQIWLGYAAILKNLLSGLHVGQQISCYTTSQACGNGLVELYVAIAMEHDCGNLLVRQNQAS